MSWEYRQRIVDTELDYLLELPAITLEGPKGVGKTSTALRRAKTVLRLDDPQERDLLRADPSRLDTNPIPILLDEWQRLPQVWDYVRRSVDRDYSSGRFLLTGSAGPTTPPSHSGAGRIVRLRMRPLSLAERSLPSPPTVSLADMLTGQARIGGKSAVTLRDYVAEILASGLPAIRTLPARLQERQLDSYLQRIVDTDLPDAGQAIRRPAALRAWLTAYAAATATTASYEEITKAATPGESAKPAKSTIVAWREILERIWMLDAVPAWLPGNNQFHRLGASRKHHLADPALAARLLKINSALLLGETGFTTNLKRTGFNPVFKGSRSFLGALFESLVTLSLRVYAQANEINEVNHLRTRDGTHEIDLLVEGGPQLRVVAFEVKLSPDVGSDDVRHLIWLRERIGERFADGAVITTGEYAYRRRDGIAVIPAALLKP